MEKDKYNNINKPVKKIKKVIAPIVTTTDLQIDEDSPLTQIVEDKNDLSNNDSAIISAASLLDNKVNEVKNDFIKDDFIKDDFLKFEFKKPKTTKKATTKKVKVDTKLKHTEVPLGVIKVISALVSMIAVVRTFAYDYIYYLTLDHPFFAMMLAALLVMVSFTSPQVVIYAWEKRNIFIGIIALIFVVLSSYYSIFVTKETIRLKRESNNIELTTNQEEVIRARVRVDEILILEKQLLSDREVEARERDSLQSASEKLIAERKDGSWEYNSMRTRLAASKERYDNLSKQILAIQDERNRLRSIDGFYSQHVKTDKEKTIESSRDLVFAIFLDFVGPVFMAFSLFL